MAEHVGAAIVVHDETKAARGDPSSYFSCSHRFLSQTIVRSSEFCETPAEHLPASAHHQQSCAAPLVTVERDAPRPSLTPQPVPRVALLHQLCALPRLLTRFRYE